MKLTCSCFLTHITIVRPRIYVYPIRVLLSSQGPTHSVFPDLPLLLPSISSSSPPSSLPNLLVIPSLLPVSPLAAICCRSFQPAVKSAAAAARQPMAAPRSVCVLKTSDANVKNNLGLSCGGEGGSTCRGHVTWKLSCRRLILHAAPIEP